MKLPLVNTLGRLGARLRLRQRFLWLDSKVERLRTRIPGLPRARVLLMMASLLVFAAVLFVVLQVLLAPKQKMTEFTLPYIQNFDDVNTKRWFPNGGVWTIREQTLAQTIGGDEAGQIHMPFKLIEDQPYHATALITLKKDTRMAGITFNAQYPDMTEKQHRVYLSRPTKDRLELVAGHTDDSGSFVPQAQVPIDVNTEKFRLDVFVYDRTYLVMLNGQRLIEKRPLEYHNGLIGFYALGPAIFDTFKLTAADSPDPGNMIYASDFGQENGGAGWVPISGTWRITDGEMRQSNPNVTDAGIAYETSTFQNYTLRATFQHTAGVGAGVMFNMASPYQLNSAQVVRFSDETDALLWGFYDAQGVFQRQGYVAVPQAGTLTYTIQIFSGETSYDVFLNDELITRDVPMSNTQGHIGLVTSLAAAQFSQVDVFPLFGSNVVTPNTQLTPAVATPLATKAITSTKPQKGTVVAKTTAKAPATPKVAPTAKPINMAAGTTAATRTPKAAVVSTSTPAPIASDFRSDFTGKLTDRGWRILSGDWRFEDGQLSQRRAQGADMSVVYTKATFDRYNLSATFTHNEGSGAGVLFNMPYSDRLAGATMVRYSERRSNAIIWGTFDETGVFQGQGFANVEPAGSDSHVLRVAVDGDSFSIFLDDKRVLDNQPLQTNSGYIGLLTTGAAVTYDQVSISSDMSAATPVPKVTNTFGNTRALSGKWEASNGVFTQTVPNLADYLLNTGSAGSVFTAEVRLRLSNTPDVGGGFIFHMADRGSKKSAYVVRLRDGGKGIWWGATDESGRFQGQGSVPIPTSAHTYKLKVIVRANKLTIVLDDKVIVNDVSINRTDGWIGLIAYGGPVTFDQLRIDSTEGSESNNNS